jgi:hypothetical protein
MTTVAAKLRTTLEMIKFEHSVFALPFALTGALLAARYAGPGWPQWRQIGWIVVAMVGARSAAMTMNRIADIEYDRRNPRTAGRPLVTGVLTLRFAWTFTLLASAVFVVAAWQLNRLALLLSPVALATLFTYSYTKRFTTYSHLVLGFCLGMGPAAAWIAITGALDWRMLVLCAGAVRRGHAVGGRLRRALRPPGRGLRPTGRPAFHPGEIRHSARAGNGPGHACGRSCAPGVAGVEFSAGLAGLGRSRRRRGAADLRAIPGGARRFVTPGRGFFYNQRLY